MLMTFAVSFTPEEIETFKNNHKAYQDFRKGKRQVYRILDLPLKQDRKSVV